MKPHLVLDFETYFDRNYSLRRLTIPQYVHDPRFHVHGLAVRHSDGRAEFRSDVSNCLNELRARYGAQLEGAVVIGHNLAFDLYVLNHCYGVRPASFVDSLLLSHHVHGRRGDGGADASLAALAERYGLQPKGDLAFMAGVNQPTGRQLLDLEDYATDDVKLTYEIFLRLVKRLTNPKMELPIMMHTIRLFTQRTLQVDLEGLLKLKEQVARETRQQLADADLAREDATGNYRFAECLAEALSRTGRQLPLKRGKNGLIPAVAKKDPDLLALLEDDDPAVSSLVEARLAVRSEQTLLARLERLQSITKRAGGLPVQLVYGGAHTGRFAGGGGFNIQNLGRSGAGEQVRELLRPAPGYVFVIGDLAQIEARVTAWLASEDDLLRDFAGGVDIYSTFINTALGWTVRKPTADDSEDLARDLKARRQVGKQAVLGLNFGMGALTFMNSLRQDRDAARLFNDGTLSGQICKQIVDAFRSRYPAIRAFGERLEDAFRDCVEGGSTPVGPLAFTGQTDAMELRLPSTRVLRYPRPRLDYTPRTIPCLDDNGSLAEFTPEGAAIVYGNEMSIYAGKLVENVAQAVARDILVEAILKLEERGFPVAFHVHDEIILEVSAAQSLEAQAVLALVLSTPPSWADGLPLKAEVAAADRYGK